MAPPSFKVVAVHSLKGGAGKSTVAANLAIELHRLGFRVGLLDGDLDSPYLSDILAIKEKVGLDENRQMLPVTYNGIRVMSFSAWVPNPFEGASMHGAFHERWLTDAIQNTIWGDTEILVADLPAGQSDEFLLLKSLFGEDLLGLVVVGLPHLAKNMERIYHAAAYHHFRILGCIENMSGAVFGEGGVRAFCKAKGLRDFGSIPMNSDIPKNVLDGIVTLPEGPCFAPIQKAAAVVAEALGRKAVAR